MDEETFQTLRAMYPGNARNATVESLLDEVDRLQAREKRLVDGITLIISVIDSGYGREARNRLTELLAALAEGKS